VAHNAHKRTLCRIRRSGTAKKRRHHTNQYPVKNRQAAFPAFFHEADSIFLYYRQLHPFSAETFLSISIQHYSENKQPLRILIIQTAFTGDTILATACIEKIKMHHPDAVIDLLVRKGNEGLFDDHPHIGTLFVWDKRKGKKTRQFKLALTFRTRRYDWCVNLQRHYSTALLTLLSGARKTAGFTTTPLSRLYTVKVRHAFNPAKGLTHEADLFLQVIGGIVPDTGRTLPRLYPRTGDRLTTAAPRYVTIAPASVWFTKQYPPEKWIAVIGLLPAGLTVYLIGGKQDAALCTFIKERAHHPSVINLAGTLTYLQSAALMKNAEMNYVNDSAPLHIATAVEAPVTAVFCSTIPAFGFGPLGQNGRIVEAATPPDCRPCGPHGFMQCPLGHFKCAAIEPARVVDDRVKSN
jgi:ADP-heptose:LPS heptosyltransferase